VRNATAAAENRLSYLEELIVRRELAINFVNTTANYDQYNCLPDWARQTLARHRRDRREAVYGFDQLAEANTHDPYWNAAMQEMLLTGYMHNYMRMYWGKKVLEWSPSPEEGYGTDSLLTRRWRGVDSNFRFRAQGFGFRDFALAPLQRLFGPAAYVAGSTQPTRREL
jgi:deoxyribodipyrimidine photo-lyase